ncbi:nuclear transport factor 2 family protein [Nocardioides sp. NPDC059952]|uniref:nuclear transport factor 2 family protein n=1 Tax=Nocardioides sp. NPDC059952 TaxID=3347014 RepID=UPI003664DC1A
MSTITAPSATLTESQVHEAADRLVAAFAATDTAAYFACFAAEASFVFHTEPRRLDDRAAYQRLWAAWVAEGWRVESCRSSARLVQVHGDTAVFSHDVLTTTSTSGPAETTRERETIVFRLIDGDLLAVHEHLSAHPSEDVR